MFSSVRVSALGLLLALALKSSSASKVVRSLAADLSYDENNRLASDVLAYENSPACQKAGLGEVKHSKFDIVTVEGEALTHIFPGSADGSCRAACLDRGVERSLAGSVMPHMYYPNSPTESFDKWFRSTCTAKEVCFMNYHNKESPLTLWWIDDEGQKHHHLDVEYGNINTRCFVSYLGHEFQIEDTSTNEVLANVIIEFVTVMGFGTSPPSDIRTPDRDMDKEIIDTLHSEWKRHERITRTFSPLGFKKGRLPPDVFASLGALYYNNRMNKVREEWKQRGVFVNWWETEVFFIQIPWHLKTIYQQRLLTLVEEWAGVPVEQTVMYGLRQYESGARLLTHVDRHTTHAVSLIVNIAQGNLTEPWPVEVQDHMDRLHEVTMEPGDIVYYESAKALHGRNRPMMGDGAYYVNLFTHYRPLNDPEWFHKPNPEGVPEPVMEVEGECKLVNRGTTATGPNGQLGLIQGVQCDDERLGPYVSPSLFTAKGPEDLIEWWRMTAPESSAPPPVKETVDSPPEESNRDEL